MASKLPKAIRVMVDDPARFAKMLEVLGLGATFGSAASYAGCSPSALRYAWKWAEGNPKRKEAREFLRRCREAIAGARSLTEAELRKSSPLVWLERGPGKMLGDEWNESAAGDAGNQQTNTTQKELIAALIILRNARISIDELIDSGRIYGAIMSNEGNTIEAEAVHQHVLGHGSDGALGAGDNDHQTTSKCNALSAANEQSDDAGLRQEYVDGMYTGTVYGDGDGTGVGAANEHMESPHSTSPIFKDLPNSPPRNIAPPTNQPKNPPTSKVTRTRNPRTKRKQVDEDDGGMKGNGTLYVDGVMTADDIRKKAVSDLVSNSRQWRDDNGVESVRVLPKEPVGQPDRKAFNNEKTNGEMEAEAIEQIEGELDHLPASLRKFLGDMN